MGCDLEVHVDGEVFLVNEGILSSFNDGSIASSHESSVKRVVLLNGIPGGPETFELIAQLSYNHGKMELTPTNTCLLQIASYFVETSKNFPSPRGLSKLAETSLEGISSWTNSQMLTALRQCSVCYPISDSCGVFEKVLRSLLGRTNSVTDGIPSDSSPESSQSRFSFDARSTASAKISTSNCSHKHWWLDDLAMFHVDAIAKIIHVMVSEKMDHSFISRFIFYHLKVRYFISSPDEKIKILETIVDSLYSLERSSISCKGLFEALRLCLSSNVCTRTSKSLDDMIGCILDQAMLDNMLIPAPVGVGTLYDVDRVMRFFKFFLKQSGCPSLTRLKKVGSLMDLYLAEIAPDPGLKPWKFMSLAMTLPNSARESSDGIYHAIDMYFKVHPGLLEEEKIMICCALDYAKLSSEACKHLAQNPNMPSWTVIKALISQQSKLRGLLQNSSDHNSSRASPCSMVQPVVLYAKRLSVSSENEKLKASLRGMQWKVMELEDMSKKLRTQMSSIVDSGRKQKRTSNRFLPWLCS